MASSSIKRSGGTSNEKIDNLFANAEVENIKLDSKSRAKIAFVFSIAFVSITGAIIIGVPIYNIFVPEGKMISIPELLSSFSSLFGTTLGFVLGYYFKDKKS